MRDGENRLIRVEPADDLNLQGGEVRVQFGYDYLGRRVWKQVETHSTQSGWQVTDVRKFVWGGTGGSSASGWLMLLELGEVEGHDRVLRKYTWGLDLAGQSGGTGVSPANVAADGSSAGLEAAGTIGGLLAIEEPLQIRDVLNYVYFYDGNGNVGQLVEWRPDLTSPPGAWSAARAAIRIYWPGAPGRPAPGQDGNHQARIGGAVSRRSLRECRGRDRFGRFAGNRGHRGGPGMTPG